MELVIKENQPFGVIVEPALAGTDINDVDLETIRALFRDEHLVVLRNFSTFKNSEDFAAYCDTWGEVSLWPFGKVLELIEQEQPADHIFDHSYVPLHWDGMYRPQVPEMQIFHCVSAPGTQHGGRTTFSHTTKVLESASQADLDLWTRVSGEYQRKMEFYHSKTVAPIVTTHPTRGLPVIRYCEPPQDNDDSFVNHPEYEFIGLADGTENHFRQSLEQALYAPSNYYAHDWQTGDIVLSDNYTLLHGREAFTSGAPRHLQRVHVLGQPALDNPHLVFHS